jgi:hypothetical protein
LPEEVTGVEALQRFGELMVRDPPRLDNTKSAADTVHTTTAQTLYCTDPCASSTSAKHDMHATGEWTPRKGDSVKLTGLNKSAQYNGLDGTVVGDLDSETGRYSVKVVYDGNTKNLSLQSQNLELVGSHKRNKRVDSRTGDESVDGPLEDMVTKENVSKAIQILDDPEIKALIDENPRFADAVQDVLANPMNFMKYLMDPEMNPLIQKAMSKLQQR